MPTDLQVVKAQLRRELKEKRVYSRTSFEAAFPSWYKDYSFLGCYGSKANSFICHIMKGGYNVKASV